ncbi:MAG: DNA topoisomerase I [Nanoarchaeota archaeon]
MPQKPKKTKEESQAENFFPVDEEDLERATEKPIKNETIDEIELKTSVEKKYSQINPKEYTEGSVEKPYHRPEKNEIEKVEKLGETGKIIKKKGKSKGKKKTKKKYSKSRKKSNSLVKQIIQYEPKKINLKPEGKGYELIITEKPQAAGKIAYALSEKVKQKSPTKGIYYYELSKEGKDIIVACAVGHLLTLKQITTGGGIPVFDVKWVPNFIANKKSDYTRKYYNNISKLVKGASSVTIATDFDVEGEVIGLNVLRYICGQEDASRMKFSTLTKSDLEESYKNKLNSIEWGQAIAGETRHYLDWFYGINLSKALMNAIKTTGRFKLMSIGRVQGPALNLIVKRERQINNFKPKPFWQIFSKVSGQTPEYQETELELQHPKDIFEEDKLEIFKELQGKFGNSETKKSQQKIPPGVPFNLTTLQTEAYKFHGITPSKTLQAAQSLYLAGLISYPRTSSQKLPESIGYDKILKKLARYYNVEKLIIKKKPVEGKKTDPAHPSIYPTGEVESSGRVLSGDEEKIYNLIVKRFLSLFCESAVVDRKKIKVIPEQEKYKKMYFSGNGSEVTKKAWMEIYPSKLKENSIEDLNGKVKFEKIFFEKKETQPPKRYSPASILSELEKRNLGTKATRSNILETLYNRGYIKDKSIEATPLGMSLIATLEKYSPIIIDEKLTRHFEEETESIRELKKQEELKPKQEKVLEEAKTNIRKIAKHFIEHQNKIGQELLNANIENIEQQKRENTLRKCPKCEKGNLIINYSRRFKRYFVACDAYPDCKNTYSLPPNGLMKPAGKTCESCGWPMISALKKGKRPWIFCFNPDCPTNEELKKKREEYKKKLQAEAGFSGISKSEKKEE